MHNKLLFLVMIYDYKSYLMTVNDIEYILLFGRNETCCFIIEYDTFEKCKYFNILIKNCEIIELSNISNITIPIFKKFNGKNMFILNSPIPTEYIRNNKIMKLRKQKLKFIETL